MEKKHCANNGVEFIQPKKNIHMYFLFNFSPRHFFNIEACVGPVTSPIMTKMTRCYNFIVTSWWSELKHFQPGGVKPEQDAKDLCQISVELVPQATSNKAVGRNRSNLAARTVTWFHLSFKRLLVADATAPIHVTSEHFMLPQAVHGTRASLRFWLWFVRERREAFVRVSMMVGK